MELMLSLPYKEKWSLMSDQTSLCPSLDCFETSLVQALLTPYQLLFCHMNSSAPTSSETDRVSE